MYNDQLCLTTGIFKNNRQFRKIEIYMTHARYQNEWLHFADNLLVPHFLHSEIRMIVCSYLTGKPQRYIH